jgi:hypothetical protein
LIPLRFLRTAAISACHRLGVFEYLRESWRTDLVKERDRATALERAVGKLQPSVDALEASLPADVEQLRAQVRRVARDTRILHTLIAVDQAQHARWDALEATLDETAIRSTVARALSTAVFDRSPMPHVVLRDVLPAATYDALLEAIPGDEFFPEKDPIKQNIKIHQLDLVPAWTRRALTCLETTIIGGILAPAIVSRMRPYLEAMYGDEYGPSSGPLVAALPHEPTAGRLMLRRPGYKLEPHLDPRRVAITCLIYFARPGDNASYGTELFAVDRPLVLDRSNTFYPRENGYECRLVKAVPFEPNTALVFLNRGGAHAAEIPADAPRETKRFSYQFYISPDQAAVDAVVVHSSEAGLKPAVARL